MHRCLLPHALPARARCVPNFLALNRLSPSTWRQTLPLRRYNTAVEEQRPNEPTQPPNLDDVSSPPEDPSTSAISSQEPRGNQEDSGDALDFILDGYEAQPVRPARAMKKERTNDAFAKYEAYIANQKTQATTRPKAPRTSRPPKKRKTESKSPRPIPRKHRLEYALTKLPRVPRLWARPRWVSIASMGQPSGHALSRVWNLNYAMAQNVFDKHQEGETFMKNSPLLDPRAPGWVEVVAQRIAENQDVNLENLANENNMNTNSVWAHAALWMLHHDKDGLLDFLLATASFAPGLWVADCLQVLAAHYTQSPSDDTTQHIKKLHHIFHLFSGNPNGEQTEFDGRFVRLLLPFSTPTQVSDLYRAMRLGDIKVHANTLMHLTTYFARHDHFHQALNVLLDAHRAGARVTSYAFRSNCSTLLRKAMDQPGGLRVCLRIVDNLVKIGVQLNTRLCNILILNAVDAGDLKTAHDIYHSLVEHNVKADQYTYALLLKGCKLDIDNADVLNQIITRAIEDINISKHPIVATEILHCLALHHTRNSGQNAWPVICQAYAQIYELQPVERLGLPMPPTVKSTPRAKEPMPVSAQAIGIMLRTYLQLTIDGHSPSARAQSIYQRYRDLVDAGVEPFKFTANSTHCYVAFLMAFTKQKRTLVNAAGVIKDMQNNAAASPPKSPAPDVQSWSVFLNGFSRHGQMALAEQVLTYMRNKGIEPNPVTWNTLLAGYSSEQDYDGVRDAMRRLDESGCAWDEWTYRGLRRFRNPEKMKAAMAERGRDVQLDFTNDLKEGLGARLNEAAGDDAWR
ncbi:hypothetical protein Q7P37_009045 [Cladosporium fusiforme]